MDMQQDGPRPFSPITVTDEVIAYMDKRGGDFRISTSCSGPVLMPVKIKPAKQSDIPIKAGSHTIYVASTSGNRLLCLFLSNPREKIERRAS